MAQIVILEKNPLHLSELKNIIRQVSSDIEILSFSSDRDFFLCYKDSAHHKSNKTTEESKDGKKSSESSSEKKEDSSNSNGDSNSSSESDDEKKPIIIFKDLALIIADHTLSTHIDKKLWTKLNNFFVSKKEKEEDTFRIIITGLSEHENQESFSDYQNNIFFNYLYKPFDELLTKQYIQLALRPPGPLSIEGIYTQEKKVTIEQIKKIQIELVTELGFRTRSSRPIEVSKSARYFGNSFSGPNGNSVYAYCYANHQLSVEPPVYSCSFSYLGVSGPQLSSIRRMIKQSEESMDHHFENLEPSTQIQPQNAVVITQNPDFLKSFTDFCQERFHGVNIRYFSRWSRFLDNLPHDFSQDTEEPKPEAEISSPSIGYELLYDSSLTYLQKINKISLEGADSSKAGHPSTNEEGEPSNEDGVTAEKAPLGEIEKIVALMDEAENKEEMKDFLGVPLARIQKDTAFLQKYISSETKFVFSQILKSKKTPPSAKSIFVLEHGEAEHPFRIVNAEAIDTDEHVGFRIFIKGLSEDERRQFHKNGDGIDLNQTLFVMLDETSFKREDFSRFKTQFTELKESTLKYSPLKSILFSQKPIDNYEQLERVTDLDDVIHLPLDYFYLTRKMKMHANQLSLKDPSQNSRQGTPVHTSIKTALPVEIDKVSEVHLSLKYYREIRVGEIRNFVMSVPNEPNMPEISAVCQYCEKLEDEVYQCDFLFFGVHQFHLEHIRKWMLHNYVSGKQKS